jgi:hypothetical protein
MITPSPAAWACAAAALAAQAAGIDVGGVDVLDRVVWVADPYVPEAVRAAGVLAARAAGGETSSLDAELSPHAWGDATSILVANADRLLDLACLAEECGALSRTQLLNVWAMS